MKDKLLIEFIGGPFDGCRHYVDIKHPLCAYVRLPVSESTILYAHGFRGGSDHMTSEADYRFEEQKNRLIYRFARALPVGTTQAERSK